MTTPRDNNLPNVRISDDDRSRAISTLGSHFAEGRLTLTEYEDRSESAAAALSKQDLDVLFSDLPALSQSSSLMPMYSAAEVERAHKDGARPRDAFMGVAALSLVGLAIITDPIWSASSVLLLLIPILAITLYVGKVGPDSWHQPSQRQLERRRLKAMKMEQKLAIEQRKAERRQQRDEITSSAMQFAARGISKRIGGAR